jgi:MFS family permease
VVLYQSNLVFGILIAFLSNYLINDLVSSDAWRYMLGAEAVPALLYSVLVTKVPQSPRWLLSKGRSAEAQEVLERLYNSQEATDQLKAIERL